VMALSKQRATGVSQTGSCPELARKGRNDDHHRHGAAARQGISAHTARTVSAALHERTGRTAGNGSLMRTAPVALAYLDDELALVEAARAVSVLTHYDPDAVMPACCGASRSATPSSPGSWTLESACSTSTQTGVTYGPRG
jgi:ADP-ribosylglycohydrolase